MTRSKNRRKTPRLSPPLIGISGVLLTLSACTETRAVRACPPAIWPSDEALAGYAACPKNDALDQWMDEIERQQCRLEGLGGCGK